MKSSQDNKEFVPIEMNYYKLVGKKHVIAMELKIMSNQGLQKNRQMVAEV